MSMTVAEIKTAMSELPHKANGNVRRFPPLLKVGIMKLVKQQGCSAVSRELGIPTSTVFAWGHGSSRSRRSRFQRLKIVASEGPRLSTLSVEGPCGLRITGTMIEMAQLIREVGHEF